MNPPGRAHHANAETLIAERLGLETQYHSRRGLGDLTLAGLQALGAVVFGVVYEFGDAAAGHGLGGIRAQQGFQKLWLEAVGLQPPIIMFRTEDDGHAGVDGGDHRVRLGGDDGEGLDDLLEIRAGVVQAEFAFLMRADPLFPEAGHTEEAAVFHGEPEWLLAGRRGLPFVKAVGGDEAALVLERFSEAGLFGDGLGAGVGEFVADGFILGPVRDETPTHGFQSGLAAFPFQDRGLLARGEIVAGSFRTGTVSKDEPDELFQLNQVARDGVAAAHRNLFFLTR